MSFKVAVYTVAYNEEPYVDRWYNYIHPETAPDDIVLVVDMGSTDRTVAALRSHCINVVHASIRPFRFDLARNTALAMIPPEVDCCVCVDMDECLVPGWRAELERVWSNYGNYSVIKYQFSPGMIFDDGRRVHSRFGWRWRYPAHEGLFAYGITAIQTPPITLAPFIVHHQNFAKDRSQYLLLLKIGLDENPTSCRMLHYYGRELYYLKLYDKALPYLEKYYEVKPASYSNPWEEEQHAIIIAGCRYYCNVATNVEKLKEIL